MSATMLTAESDATQAAEGVEAESAPALDRSRLFERVCLVVLVVLYLVCVIGFALVTPYGEAPDENGHLTYVEYMARYLKLPPISPTPYSYDSFHPPLYYMPGAALVVAVRTLTGKKLDAVIASPLHADPNRQPLVHPAVMLHPAKDRWQFWPYALRALSALMGVGVILLTYATARVLVPRPAPATVPLLATSFAALVPGVNFIRGSISNENGADLVGALVIWLLALHLARPHSDRRVLWIGVALGLGFLTKLSVTLLVIPAVWVLWVRSERQLRRFGRDMLAVFACIAVVAGWFYVYRWIAYGDPLALNAWHAMITPDSTYRLSDLFWFQDPFRGMLWKSFWGVYGWQQIFMSDWIYDAFFGATVLALIGGAYLLVRRAFTTAQQHICAVLLSMLVLMYALVVLASLYLIAWQGRELYPAFSSVCVLLGVGISGLALGRAAVRPLNVQGWRRALAPAVVGATAIGLFAVNVYSIVWLVLPGLNT